MLCQGPVVVYQFDRFSESPKSSDEIVTVIILHTTFWEEHNLPTKTHKHTSQLH